MPWMSHADVAGAAVLVTQAQFDLVWEPKGWIVADPPTGEEYSPPSQWMHFAGTWHANAVYQEGDVVRTPGGGLIEASTILTTGDTFNETGWNRLEEDDADEGDSIIDGGSAA